MNTDSNHTKAAVEAATVEGFRSASRFPKNTADIRSRLKRFLAYAGFLVLCFARPLLHLIVYSAHSDLYSHILLIPFICAYLIWIKRDRLRDWQGLGGKFVVAPFVGSALILGGYQLALRNGWTPDEADRLSCVIFSFVLLLIAGALAFLGTRLVRVIAFEAAFAFFCVPFPTVVRHWLETFFQHGSAGTAYLLLTAVGMPVLRTGTHFQLPGFAMNVAPECSGIHSSLVLVITSLIAGSLFLNSPSKRLLLTAIVVPLALLRNGFRIFVIAQLCVHIGPQMIESPIHRKGGPVFFVLSLIPFFLLLSYLRKREQPKTEV